MFKPPNMAVICAGLCRLCWGMYLASVEHRADDRVPGHDGPQSFKLCLGHNSFFSFGSGLVPALLLSKRLKTLKNFGFVCIRDFLL